MCNEISCTKLQLPPQPLNRGLLPPDPHSLCPLSSTEFVKLNYRTNRIKIYRLIGNSAGRAPSLRLTPWHLPYN